MDVKLPTKAVTEHLEEVVAHDKDSTSVLDDQWGFSCMSQSDRTDMDKKLVRKLDSRLLPMLVIMYFFNFVDRSNLANARLGGLEKDLGMSGNDFNTATSIFFVGYIIMQLPSNLLITLVRPSLYLATVMTVWGALTTCTAAAKDFKHLVVIRFFLGFVEAPFFPGSMFLMSSWYTRSELGVRYAFFYGGSALANSFNGLISAGILSNLDGKAGHKGWQWIFIISGSLTMFFAMASVFVLPNYPRTTRWLTPRERAFAEYRLLEDIGEQDGDDATGLLQSTKMALCDYRVWIFVLTQHCNILTQSFTYFFPSIVSSLGYSRTATLLLTAPPWFASFLACLCVTYHASRTRERCFHIVVPSLLALLGAALMIGSTRLPVRFVAMFLLPMGTLPAFQVILTWVSNSFPRPRAKRAAAISIVNMLGNVGSVYGAFLWPASAAPRYLTGGATLVSVSALTCVGALAIRYALARENAALARREALTGAGVGFRHIL